MLHDIIDKSHQDWVFIQNVFYNATKRSRKRFEKLSADHYAKLEGQQNAVGIGTLYTRYALVHGKFLQAGLTWRNSQKEYHKLTDEVNQKQEQLGKESLVWKAVVLRDYANTSVYEDLFGEGRSGFILGSREERLAYLRLFIKRLSGYTSLASLHQSVQSYYEAFWALFNKQQQAEIALDLASDELIRTHREAAELMYRNLGILMDIYGSNYAVAHFFDLSLIRRSSRAASNTATSKVNE